MHDASITKNRMSKFAAVPCSRVIVSIDGRTDRYTDKANSCILSLCSRLNKCSC